MTPVNDWLLNGSPKPIVLEFRNLWLKLLTVMVGTITLIWTYRVLYTPTQPDQSFRDMPKRARCRSNHLDKL